MKKKIKYIAAVGALLAMAMVLCSCKQLDEMKLNHAVYTEKDKTNTIEFRGKTYTLYEGKVDGPQWKQDSMIIYDNPSVAHVTEPDVPTLLASSKGKQIRFSDCGEEAPLFFAMDAPSASNDWTLFYCDTDHISEFGDMIEDAKMDHLFSFHDEKQEGENIKWSYRSAPKLFPEDANSAIFRTIERPFNPATDYSKMADIKDASGEYLDPQFCDRNLIFTNNQELQIVRTNGAKKKYYIGYQQPFTAEWEDDGSLSNAEWKLVDAKDTKAMDALFEEFQVTLYNLNMYDGAMQYEQLTPLQ